MNVRALAPAQAFSALRHPHYRRFWWGGLVSLIGSWIQITAQGWLVYDLTGSPFMLGTVTMVNTIPTMLLGLVGGVVADRSEKRHLLLATQGTFMLVSAILAVLTLTGQIAVWHILVLSAASGVAAAMDMPARQSLLAHLVDRDDLMNAVALNSAVFNGSRIIGPVIAGVIIDQFGNRAGPGLSFALNTVTYLAVLGALATIPVNSRPPAAERQDLMRELREGLAFALGQPVLRALLALLAVTGVFGLSFTVLLPVFARDVLHVAARGYGLLLTASGLGATVGVLALAAARPARMEVVILTLYGAFAVLLAAFAASPAFAVSLVLIVGVSGTVTAYMSATNTTIQTMVPDGLRGRVMSLYILAFFGTAPLGGLFMGALAQAAGARVAVLCGAAVCAAAALAVR
ncbi:MAG: MFS transporter, partial [Armatimonadota bacterium]|nr:MFS transporter [Armatimonadota bacterium]